MDNDFKETIAPGEKKPDDGKLTPEEEKFLAMLDEDRPAPLDDDVSSTGDDMSPQNSPESSKLGIVRILIYTILLVTIILGVYFLFPKKHDQKKPIVRCRSISDIPIETFADERYGEMMKEALDAYFRGDFTRCIAALHPHLNEIVADRKSNENAADALSLYLHTIRFAQISTAIQHDTLVMLAQLSKEEPDNAVWPIASMRLSYGDTMDYRRFFELSKTKMRDWQYYLSRCNYVLTECDRLEQIQRRRIAAAEDDYKPRLRSALTDILAVQCSVYASKWILEGGEGKANLPDDEGDRGVASREKAVRIAMDKDADCGKFKESTPEFYEVRNFIALTIKSQANGLFNSYFWNGEKYSRITPLQREINKTSSKLAKLKKSNARH